MMPDKRYSINSRDQKIASWISCDIQTIKSKTVEDFWRKSKVFIVEVRSLTKCILISAFLKKFEKVMFKTYFSIWGHEPLIRFFIDILKLIQRKRVNVCS